jgi:hypothetical protein
MSEGAVVARQTAIGHMTWVIPGGHIPLKSTGREPECTSRDEICILNTAETPANVSITVYYGNRDPAGPYELLVLAQRVMAVRFNDLINPEAIPLDEPYACVIESTVPVVVQFTRQDTSQAANAMTTTMAFPWTT